MKEIERRVGAIEERMIKQFNDTWYVELTKEANTQRERTHAVIDDFKAYMEISSSLIQGDDMTAIIKRCQAMITIVEHHLPECAARIKEKLSWL